MEQLSSRVFASVLKATLWDCDEEKKKVLGQRDFGFKDPRLAELLFRYRARNWPYTLSMAEAERWRDYRRSRLCEDRGLSEFTFESHRAEIAALRAAHADDGHAQALLDQLQAWAQTLETALT